MRLDVDNDSLLSSDKLWILMWAYYESFLFNSLFISFHASKLQFEYFANLSECHSMSIFQLFSL